METLVNIALSILEFFAPDNEKLKGFLATKRAKDIQDTVKTLVLEIVLEASKTSYPIPEYQRLNNTILVDVMAPVSNKLTKSMKNNDIAPAEATINGFLNLQNTRSQNVYEVVPGIDLLTAYDTANGVSFTPNPRTGFRMLDVDWTKAKWSYPSVTIPAANVGKAVLLIVKYIDIPEPKY